MSFKPLMAPPKKRVIVELDKDENGRGYITERYLKELCETNGQFANPALNDTLYLHYKGFTRIENLDAYKNIKSLWLESNGISKIEGLENLHKLRMIYLHQNTLKKIENLNHLTNLVTINLSHNMISNLEGLAGLVNLKNLDLQTNCIDSIDNMQELKELPQLQSLDMKNNQLDDRDRVVPFFASMPQIHALYLKGNPCVRFISKYRRVMTEQLPGLNYLDDRPIFDHERIVADAFVRGGDEEVKRVK